MFDDYSDVETDIICKYIASTNKAILIEVDGEREWLPMSQISDASVDLNDIPALDRGDPLTITIPEWLAEEKGLV